MASRNFGLPIHLATLFYVVAISIFYVIFRDVKASA